MTHPPKVELRPGVTNSGLWFPERPKGAAWDRIRSAVMERDDWTCAACDHRAKKWMQTHHLGDSADHSPDNLAALCVACHAVMHVGLSLMQQVVEVWECGVPQIEVVRISREGVRQGRSLAEVKASLPLSRGPLDPTDVAYANNLLREMGTAQRAYLDPPLCAVFVSLQRWQLEDAEPGAAAGRGRK